MTPRICPYDGAQCLDNCRYPCPGLRRAAQRAVMPRVLVIGALALAILTVIWALRAHGAEMRQQSIPTAGRISADGRGKFARNAVLLSGPCWIAMNSAALLDLRWQCTYWGANQ